MDTKKFMTLFSGGGITYDQQIIATAPIAYWPLTELAGAAAVNYGTLGVAANGAYTGVDLAQLAAPGGGMCPYFDGANDLCNIYSAALSGAYNGQLISVAVWWRVYEAAIWTDAAQHHVLRLYRDANNLIDLYKATTNNRITISYRAGAVSKTVNTLGYANQNWHHFVMTATLAGDAAIYYMDGAQVDVTQTGIGTWLAGALGADYNAMGVNRVSTVAAPWKGYISRSAVWDRVLTPTEVLALYNGGL